ncbi:MAG: AAA family ATPase [Candidatus Nanopelagicales bacterium]
MRLIRLELASYGAYADRGIDLGPGLTVIHGPNESGKSTLRHAIADLLWGMSARSHPYAFLVSNAQLRLAGTVTTAGGAGGEASLVVDSRGCRDPEGRPVQPWWRDGPIGSRESWATALGLDITGLRSGGRSVLADGGDLAEMLFRARTGIDLTATLDALTAKADASYRRHRGNRGVRVRLLLADVERAREATAAATSSAADVVRLRGEMERLASTAEAAEAWYARCDAVFAEAEEAVRAWEPAARLAASVLRQAQLRAEGRVLDEADLAAHDEAREKVNELTRRIAELDADLASIDEERASLVIDESVVSEAPAVDGLAQRTALERQRIDRLVADRAGCARAGEAIRSMVGRLAPAGPEPATGIGSPDEARAMASHLLIGIDVVDRLDRAAADAVARADDVRTQEADVAAARARLTSLDPAAIDPAGRTAALGARRDRDRAWHEVRAPWLSGDLPDSGTRGRLAAAVDATTAAADQASDAAAGHAESAGRAMEVDRHLGELMTRLDEMHGRRRAADADWADLLALSGLPPVLDAAAWAVRRGLLAELAALLEEDDTLRDRIASDGAVAESFAREVLSSGARMGIAGTDPWLVLAEAGRRVAATRGNEQLLGALAQRREKAAKKRSERAALLQGQVAVLARLAADDDLAEVVARSTAVASEREVEQECLGKLRAAARPGTVVEDLAAKVGRLTQAEVAAQKDEAEDARAEALGRRDAARDALREARTAVQEAERVGNAADLRAREIETAEVLAGEVAEYVQTRVMILALQRLLDAGEPDNDNALLAHASALANRLTAGRITGLTVEEQAGERRLRIEAAALEDGAADELSEGTADQVYLALRLAGIRQMQERAAAEGKETLPVVLDDVLVTHDDERTAVALDVLAGEARDQQIVLMTHHRAVADAAARAGAAVCSLEPLPDLAQPAPMARAERARIEGDGPDPADVREWARAQGLEVGQRGRLKGWIVAAYLAREAADHDG